MAARPRRGLAPPFCKPVRWLCAGFHNGRAIRISALHIQMCLVVTSHLHLWWGRDCRDWPYQARLQISQRGMFPCLILNDTDEVLHMSCEARQARFETLRAWDKDWPDKPVRLVKSVHFLVNKHFTSSRLTPHQKTFHLTWKEGCAAKLDGQCLKKSLYLFTWPCFEWVCSFVSARTAWYEWKFWRGVQFRIWTNASWLLLRYEQADKLLSMETDTLLKDGTYQHMYYRLRRRGYGKMAVSPWLLHAFTLSFVFRIAVLVLLRWKF